MRDTGTPDRCNTAFSMVEVPRIAQNCVAPDGVAVDAIHRGIHRRAGYRAMI